VVAEVKGERRSPWGVDPGAAIRILSRGPGAAERKRLNTKKEQALDSMLHRKVFRKEALGWASTRRTRTRKVQEYEIETLFGCSWPR